MSGDSVATGLVSGRARLSSGLWIAILVGLFTAALQPWLESWELRIVDSWFRVPSRQVRADSRLVLVLIDDTTLESLKTPMAFWAPHFSRVTAALVKAGVAGVGLDWLPYEMEAEIFPAIQPFFPEIGSVQDNPWLPLFLALQERGDHPMVQGIYPPNFQKSLGRAPSGMLDQYRPASELMAMLGQSQLGFLNLSRDRDGVLRSQVMLPLRLSEPLWGATSFSPFAARVAEVSTGQNLEPDLPTWDKRPLPLDGQGGLRMNYFSQPSAIRRLSFSDVWQMTSNPEQMRQQFQGKIVLIGPGTKVFQDLVQTPVGEMFGVEAHATALNTLLTHQYLNQATPAQTYLILILLVLLGAALGLELPLPLSLALIVVMDLIYWQGLRWLFLQQQLLAPLLGPLSGSMLAWALGAATQARQKSLEGRYIRQLFGRYVSPDVMEVLLKDPAQTRLGAVGKRHITVLFTDINGFSGHCEKKTPEKIMSMLNDYFEHMNRIIFRHGGSIKQFVGDEIMAMFGAPLAHPEAEKAAVLAAVEMIGHLEAMRQGDPQEEQGFYHIKVGIHSGEVILGNVGSAERTEYAAVGDDVNLGSRLMGMTKTLHADVLISAEVFEKVRDLPGLIFEAKGAHLVKGRVEPVQIYSVQADPAGRGQPD